MRVRAVATIGLCCALAACEGNHDELESASPTYTSLNSTPAPTFTTQPQGDPPAVTNDGNVAATPTPTPTPTPTVGPAATPTPDPGTAGDGNFVIGPNYANAPELTANGSVPHGTTTHFTMNSVDSKIYGGLDPSLSSPARFTRDLWLYVPHQYVAGTEAPFMVVQDGGGYMEMSTALDNLIAAKKLPVMLVIYINPGPGDGRGSERGLEYDTVSDAYVRFIETEVLPKVSHDYNVKFTTDPEGRASMGGSSGGAAAFTMAWFRPDLYHRVLTYSGTFVNQHPDATYPHSAWSYHEFLIKQNAAKPIRVALEAGQNDNNLDSVFNDGMHSWLTANDRMAAVLSAKGYHYRFVYALGAGHVDSRVVQQTLPNTLLWLWRDYPIK